MENKNRIIFATCNQNKMKEIREIFNDFNLQVYSMEEVGIKIDIEETGTTFEENAMIKAETISRYFPEDIILADDSGLEIDYLDKNPGVYSARYLGHETSYSIKNQMILDRLKGVPDKKRIAKYICAVAAILPNGTKKVVSGVIEGIIGHKPEGKNGFAYDPIFYIPELGCTMAQLSIEMKNLISHRRNALCEMRNYLTAVGIMEEIFGDS